MKRRGKGTEPEGGWQNVAVWDEEGENLRGNINFTLDFLELLVQKIDDGELDIEENQNGDEAVTLKIVLRPNPNAGGRRDPEMLGNVYFPQGDKQAGSRRRAKPRTRRRR